MRFLLALFLLAGASLAQEAAFTPKPYRRAVITWVPPYGTAKVKAALRTPAGGVEPGSVLTHVALQFWAPDAAGLASRVTKYDKLTDELIADWRDWCHARGIRVLLCVYNGVEKWDWGLAHNAFAKQPREFADSLLAEVERHALDGIDLDLEGNGSFDADKPPFLAFVKLLSGELRARQKQLFADTFAYIWNAPNQRWWPELFPLVDGVNSMGYEETGAHSTAWRGYGAQAAAAGKDAGKLAIGLPTHLERWQENSVLEHLDWLAAKKDGPGVALWDAQFLAPAWRTAEPWRRLQKIRGQ